MSVPATTTSARPMSMRGYGERSGHMERLARKRERIHACMRTGLFITVYACTHARAKVRAYACMHACVQIYRGMHCICVRTIMALLPMASKSAEGAALVFFFAHAAPGSPGHSTTLRHIANTGSLHMAATLLESEGGEGRKRGDSAGGWFWARRWKSRSEDRDF